MRPEWMGEECMASLRKERHDAAQGHTVPIRSTPHLKRAIKVVADDVVDIYNVREKG